MNMPTTCPFCSEPRLCTCTDCPGCNHIAFDRDRGECLNCDYAELKLGPARFRKVVALYPRAA